MDLIHRFKQYQEVYRQAQGKHLDQAITEILQNIDLSHWKGRFLQIGAAGQLHWYETLQTAAKYKLSPRWDDGVDVLALPDEIPFGSQAIDVVYAPFILDLGVAVAPFIHEVDRILSSMGLVILIGLNPTGLWRLSRFFNWGTKKWYQCSLGCSVWRLRRLFHQLNYDVLMMDFFYFIPPVQKNVLLKYFAMINRISKYLAFYPPSFYILVVQKRDKAFLELLAVEKSSAC